MQHPGVPTVYPHTGMKDKRMTAEDIRSYGKSYSPLHLDGGARTSYTEDEKGITPTNG